MILSKQLQNDLFEYIELDSSRDLSSFLSQFSRSQINQIINDNYCIGNQENIFLLNYAVENNKTKVIEFLIKNGADIYRLNNNGFSNITFAAAKGYCEAVAILTKYGFDVNRVDGRGNLALIYAADLGDVEVVQILINNGAKIDKVNDFGLTGLIKASKNGNFGIVRLLIENGANVNMFDVFMNTSLTYASANGFYDIAKYLVQNGADVNWQNYRGEKPSIWAAVNGHKKIVNFLLKEEGVNIKDIPHSSSLSNLVLDLALQDNNVELAEALLIKGTKFKEIVVENFKTIKSVIKNNKVKYLDFTNAEFQYCSLDKLLFPKHITNELFYDNFSLLDIRYKNEEISKNNKLARKTLSRILQRNNEINDLIKNNRLIDVDRAKLCWIKSRISAEKFDAIDAILLAKMFKDIDKDVIDSIVLEFDFKLSLFIEKKIDQITFNKVKSIEQKAVSIAHIPYDNYEVKINNLLYKVTDKIFNLNFINDEKIESKFLDQVTKYIFEDRSLSLIKKFQESSNRDYLFKMADKIVDWSVGLNFLSNFYLVGSPKEIDLCKFLERAVSITDDELNCKFNFHDLLDNLDDERLLLLRNVFDVKKADCKDADLVLKFEKLEIDQYCQRRLKDQKFISQSFSQNPNTNPSPTHFSQADQGRSRDLDSRMRM